MGKRKDDDDNVVPLPTKCPPHMWEAIYNADGEICGRVCLKCGTLEGSWS